MDEVFVSERVVGLQPFYVIVFRCPLGTDVYVWEVFKWVTEASYLAEKPEPSRKVDLKSSSTTQGDGENRKWIPDFCT